MPVAGPGHEDVRVYSDYFAIEVKEWSSGISGNDGGVGGDRIGKSAAYSVGENASESEGRWTADDGTAGVTGGDGPVAHLVSIFLYVRTERKGSGGIDLEKGTVGFVIGAERGGWKLAAV